MKHLKWLLIVYFIYYLLEIHWLGISDVPASEPKCYDNDCISGTSKINF